MPSLVGGSNNNSEPPGSNYTSEPTQTSVTLFQGGNNEAFGQGRYWSSSEVDSHYSRAQNFSHGAQTSHIKCCAQQAVRAVRRLPL